MYRWISKIYKIRSIRYDRRINKVFITSLSLENFDKVSKILSNFICNKKNIPESIERKLSFSPRSRILEFRNKFSDQRSNQWSLSKSVLFENRSNAQRFEISIESKRKKGERKMSSRRSKSRSRSRNVGLVCNGAACAGVKRQIGTYNGDLWGVRERVKRIFHARWLKACCTTTLLFTRAVLRVFFCRGEKKKKIFFDRWLEPWAREKAEILENHGKINFLSHCPRVIFSPLFFFLSVPSFPLFDLFENH